MKIIERKFYLDRLFSVKGTPDIKIITGIRRCGKSILLETFINKVKEHNPAANIVHINFNDVSFEPYREYHALNYFVEKQYVQNKENILCIDEIQNCKNFEIVINSLHSQNRWDIYITGSNAFLLSSDLATLFTGRVFPIEVYPFSFSEFCEYFEITDNKEGFRRYIKEGGFAGSYLYVGEDERSTYLKSVFSTLIIRDIVDKYKIRTPELLERITDYLID
ncbi:MAG: AAA family ATPase, partial [Sphaerochaetaceae bacterium]|nr:AAA family ATPase [Sphaerochaetaceae bacterium]